MVGTGSEGFMVGLAAVTVVRGRMVKGGVARALVSGEEAVGVGSPCFFRTTSASDPTVTVVIKVVARDVEGGGGVIHNGTRMRGGGRRSEGALRVSVKFAAVGFDGSDAPSDCYGPGLHSFVMH